MPVDWDREQTSWDVAARAEPSKDWLATVIRRVLWSSVGGVEPSPEIWIRIRQNIATMGLSLSHKEENSTMLSYTDFLVRQEQYKDLLWEAEHERLIQAAKHRQPGNQRLHRKVVGWIGIQMVRWGWKLQHYSTTPSIRYPQAACDH